MSRVVFNDDPRKYGSKRSLEYKLAKMPGVQDALMDHANLAADRARANLAAHRREGHSRIYVEKGKVDVHVGISDERGEKAAAAIELGTWRSQGLYVLHRAFALDGKRGRR